MPTPRQIQRRQNILDAARRLIVTRGYDGVTMRELAREGGVTTKTLYHRFGSRERLLRAAVEERFRDIYADIVATPIEHGFDRLFYIVDTVAATTHEHRAYARALASIFSDPAEETFANIRATAYRDAVLQIARAGDFEPWVNVDLIAAVVYRQVNPIYYTSWIGRVPAAARVAVAKLGIALVLAPTTQGYTHARAQETIRELQDISAAHV